MSAKSLGSLIGCQAPPGRDLTVVELELLAEQIAAAPALWQQHVRHERDHHFYVELHRESHVDVWLICWDAAQETGLHDHDRSSGAVSVVEGTLLEDVLGVGGDGRIGLQTVAHPAGGASASTRPTSTTFATTEAHPRPRSTSTRRRCGGWAATPWAPAGSGGSRCRTSTILLLEDGERDC